MSNKSRISSILNSLSLNPSVTGLQSFDLKDLEIVGELDFPLPEHLRLGHLTEKIVSALITSSSNYEVLHEGVQIIEDEKTIGEIDFIVSNTRSKEVSHVELAYKFYLFDPSISSVELENWIGPNRNDTLKKKLDKVKGNQFPLLFHPEVKNKLGALNINSIDQMLCLLVSLYVPYEPKLTLASAYNEGVKGYYLSYNAFVDLDHSRKSYYLPQKKEWGIDPSENQVWENFDQIKDQVAKRIEDRRSLLCWQKQEQSFSEFFIVWW